MNRDIHDSNNVNKKSNNNSSDNNTLEAGFWFHVRGNGS